MKKTLVSTLALVAASDMASAGGFDRVGQNISIMYEEGTVGQIAFSSVFDGIWYI